MGWYSVDCALPGPIDETSATQKNALGKIVRCRHTTYGEGEFIYLKGLDSTIVGSWVHYNPDDWSTTLAVADGVGPLAIAMSANLTGYYGWYQLSGKAIGATKDDVADDAVLYLTDTAGKVDDADVAGDYIYKAKAAADGTGATTIEVEIARPFTNDAADD